jgi:hypothetical protein
VISKSTKLRGPGKTAHFFCAHFSRATVAMSWFDFQPTSLEELENSDVEARLGTATEGVATMSMSADHAATEQAPASPGVLDDSQVVPPDDSSRYGGGGLTMAEIEGAGEVGGFPMAIPAAFFVGLPLDLARLLQSLNVLRMSLSLSLTNSSIRPNATLADRKRHYSGHLSAVRHISSLFCDLQDCTMSAELYPRVMPFILYYSSTIPVLMAAIQSCSLFDWSLQAGKINCATAVANGTRERTLAQECVDAAERTHMNLLLRIAAVSARDVADPFEADVLCGGDCNCAAFTEELVEDDNSHSEDDDDYDGDINDSSDDGDNASADAVADTHGDVLNDSNLSKKKREGLVHAKSVTKLATAISDSRLCAELTQIRKTLRDQGHADIKLPDVDSQPDANLDDIQKAMFHLQRTEVLHLYWAGHYLSSHVSKKTANVQQKIALKVHAYIDDYRIIAHLTLLTKERFARKSASKHVRPFNLSLKKFKEALGSLTSKLQNLYSNSLVE